MLDKLLSWLKNSETAQSTLIIIHLFNFSSPPLRLLRLFFFLNQSNELFRCENSLRQLVVIFFFTKRGKPKIANCTLCHLVLCLMIMIHLMQGPLCPGNHLEKIMGRVFIYFCFLIILTGWKEARVGGRWDIDDWPVTSRCWPTYCGLILVTGFTLITIGKLSYYSNHTIHHIMFHICIRDCSHTT